MGINEKFPPPEQLGLFLLMGYGHAPQLEIAQYFANLEGCHKLNRSFGRAGTMFLYTTHEDVAENDSMFVLNLGLARDKETGQVLSANNLLEWKLVTPDNVAHDKLLGNYFIIGISKHEPKACFFRSVIGTSTLFYHQAEETLICSDNLRLLIPFLPTVETPPEALLTHLLFRAVNGSTSYLRHVYRFEHGYQARWNGNQFSPRLTQDLRAFQPATVTQMDDTSISAFREQVEKLVSSYTSWLYQNGYDFANQLSGGIDSSTLQYFINQSLFDKAPVKSFSYALAMPGFNHEIEYAQSASQSLHTQHEFIQLEPRYYPDLLQQTIEIVGQPVGHESMPGQMAVAQYLANHHPQIGFIFTGVASDTLHGTESAKRQLQLDAFKRVPLAAMGFKAVAMLFKPFLPHKAYGSRELANLLQAAQNINSPHHPLNTQGLFTDLDMVEKCFGHKAVQEVRFHKRNFETIYFDAKSTVEKVHVLQLTALVADEQPLINRMYNSYGLQMLFPYLDYEFMQATFAFDPRIRFYAQGRTKPIMKRILETRSNYDHVDKRKGHSGFDHDLRVWMKEGVLRDMTQAIERPAFMERTDFERKLEQPDWFTWNLLTFDLFQKHVLQG